MTTHGQLCSSHLSRPACIALPHSLLPNSCQISHSCCLPPSTVSPSTISALQSICVFIFIYTKPVFLKGEDILPSKFQTLRRGLLAHPKIFGVNLQLGGMFLAKRVHYAKKSLRVVQVLHHVVDGGENLLAVAPDLIRLFHLFSRVHAFEVCKVGLGVWVLSKHPVEK